eukprot:PhM_4_TR14801/c0_g1_i1/m.89272
MSDAVREYLSTLPTRVGQDDDHFLLQALPTLSDCDHQQKQRLDDEETLSADGNGDISVSDDTSRGITEDRIKFEQHESNNADGDDEGSPVVPLRARGPNKAKRGQNGDNRKRTQREEETAEYFRKKAKESRAVTMHNYRVLQQSVPEPTITAAHSQTRVLNHACDYISFLHNVVVELSAEQGRLRAACEAEGKRVNRLS